MLEIKDLHASVGGRKVLDGINLSKPQAVTYAKHYKPLESLQLEKFLVLTGQ